MKVAIIGYGGRGRLYSDILKDKEAELAEKEDVLKKKEALNQFVPGINFSKMKS